MRHLRFLLIAAAIALPACAHTKTPAPVIMPEAALGRVIIYRNGVAYYERNAIVDGELSLKVPRARVDDFLKSLSVVDLESGKPLAISYPTTPAGVDRFVAMDIELPKGRRRVKITYVTESPAWKPSYRVVLGAPGKSRLQSWAVVDNVSGEAWDNVQVGVGSTSALSFRYDLHSVRVVERETIGHGTKIAAAPPTGGSPYATDGKEQRLLANVSDTDLEAGARVAVNAVPMAGADVGGRDLRQGVGASGTGDATTRLAGKAAGRSRPKLAANKTSKDAAAPRGQGKKKATSALDRLAGQLRGNGERIRLEGYAIAGASEGQDDGLRRANTLREQLVNRGISPDRIDVVAGAMPVADATEAIRVVAVDEQTTATQAAGDDGPDGAPRGTAHFVSDGPISLDAGRSAMVTLLDEPTAAQRVYLYDPISSRGSRRFAFNAIRLDNPSD
ncbi:MAG: OmpA family protein, partial [Myxococcota bacterium]